MWDTVNTVGVPSEGLRKVIGTVFYRYTFPKTDLSDRVDKACQALAEERHSFLPVLWDESNQEAPSSPGGNTPAEPQIKQVWFTGMHADVGGGYKKHEMALVPLHWMMTEAKIWGLRFNEGDEDWGARRRNENGGSVAQGRPGPTEEGLGRPGPERPGTPRTTVDSSAPCTSMYAPAILGSWRSDSRALTGRRASNGAVRLAAPLPGRSRTAGVVGNCRRIPRLCGDPGKSEPESVSARFH